MTHLLPSRGVPLTLVPTEKWTHTLLLTGELNSRSAPALEEEIESLCQEGVAVLRLDLRDLSSIDHAGIAVIAYRSRECGRQGCGIEVLSTVPFVRAALRDAGVALVNDEPEHQEAAASGGQLARTTEATSALGAR